MSTNKVFWAAGTSGFLAALLASDTGSFQHIISAFGVAIGIWFGPKT